MALEKTLTALIEEAEGLCDETANNKVWAEWFNNGLDDLAPVLYLDKKVDVTKSINDDYPLPTDVLSIINVFADNNILQPLSNNDYTSTGYRVIDGKINTQGISPDNVSVYYYRFPAYTSTASSSDNVDVPNYATKAIVYFGCAQCMLKEDEPDRYAAFMQLYTQSKEDIRITAKSKRQGISGYWGVVR